jgi:hypothetical protein
MSTSAVLPLLGAFVLFILWPVFFFVIRRRAREAGRGAGWRHAAFFLGPLGAPVVFVLLKISDKATPKSR